MQSRLTTETRIKSYSELCELDTLKERLNYLKTNGLIGELTIGGHRQLVQAFYSSKEWKKARRDVIIRDDGCELGLKGFAIPGRVIVHHINPITIDDLIYKRPCLVDPENLVCSSQLMHSAIHYEADIDLGVEITERSKNDTCPWRR